MSERIVAIQRGTRTEHSKRFLRLLSFMEKINREVDSGVRTTYRGNEIGSITTGIKTMQSLDHLKDYIDQLIYSGELDKESELHREAYLNLYIKHGEQVLKQMESIIRLTEGTGN